MNGGILNGLIFQDWEIIGVINIAEEDGIWLTINY